MSAQSLLPWFVPEGVTPGRADHRDIVLVAGTDPYASKGTADVMRPHIRPDGQGGCLRWPLVWSAATARRQPAQPCHAPHPTSTATTVGRVLERGAASG
jgi:phytanoyl-CoA hydroxylase